MKKNIFISVLFLFHMFASAQTIAVGSGHFHALCNDSTVQSWGGGTDGELGNGTFTNSNTPVSVNFLTGIISVAAGSGHCLSLKNDGTVWTWGYNYAGQLGDGTHNNSNLPLQVSSLTGIIAIATGTDFSLALKNDGTVWGWGHNGNGQLGNGFNVSSNIPVQSVITDVITIACGATHSLALKKDGTVWAWGNNGNGQLGTGTYANSNFPVQISSLTGIIAIAGSAHSLALKNDGTVWAWGWNYEGQLGNGTNGTHTDSNVPMQVSGLTSIKAIVCGWAHSLALKNDGTLWAWGNGGYGQFGNGTNTSSNVPIPVNSLTGITAIAGGYYSSLARKNDDVWVWGGNSTSNVTVQVMGLCQVTTEITEIAEKLPDATHALTNIEQTENSNSFFVYPNPTGNSITVNIQNINATDAFTLRVTNALGEIVYSEDVKDASASLNITTNGFTKQIDLSLLPKGIYFVELQPTVFNSSHNTTKRNITKLILQ